jgi:hypothetical protein
MAAALAAAAAWALWPGGTTPAVAGSPYTTAIDCLRYNQRTGRVPIRLTVTNTTARPLRFRGHVDITIARVRPGSADHVRFARIAAVSPLTTIRPGRTFRWATRSRPVQLHGASGHLKVGACTFFADPPRD